MAIHSPKSSRKWILNFFYGGDRDITPKTKNFLLVATTLIAAATFQAGVNPPGGVWQETTVKNVVAAQSPEAGRSVFAQHIPSFTGPSFTEFLFAPDSDDSHEAGRSVFAQHRRSFTSFLICNTLAFSISIHLMLHLMVDNPFFLEIFVATTAMVATYWSAIYEITPDDLRKYRLILVTVVFPYLFQICLQVGYCLKKKICG